MPSQGPDQFSRISTWLLAAAASLAAGMVAIGVIAGVALERTLAVTYIVDVGWHAGRRFALALDIAATLVLTVLTVVIVFATRNVSAARGRVIAGVLAAALVFACALPGAGWFWLIAQDGLATEQEFTLQAYGRWYYPVVGVFGAAYALAAAAAAVLLLLPRSLLSRSHLRRGDWPAEGEGRL